MTKTAKSIAERFWRSFEFSRIGDEFKYLQKFQEHLDTQGFNQHCELELVNPMGFLSSTNLSIIRSPNEQPKFHGVSFHSHSGRYKAVVTYRGTTTLIGYFNTAEEAALQRDLRVVQMGITRPLNFPDNISCIVTTPHRLNRASRRIALNFWQNNIHNLAEEFNTFELFELYLTHNGFYEHCGLSLNNSESLLSIENLRIIQPNAKSDKFLGVTFDKNSNQYKAYVTWKNKTELVGYYKTQEDAALQRDIKVLQMGIPRTLNFPDEAKFLQGWLL